VWWKLLRNQRFGTMAFSWWRLSTGLVSSSFFSIISWSICFRYRPMISSKAYWCSSRDSQRSVNSTNNQGFTFKMWDSLKKLDPSCLCSPAGDLWFGCSPGSAGREVCIWTAPDTLCLPRCTKDRENRASYWVLVIDYSPYGVKSDVTYIGFWGCTIKLYIYIVFERRIFDYPINQVNKQQNNISKWSLVAGLKSA